MEQIQNYEENGEYMEANEYKNKLDSLIKQYKENAEELKVSKKKTSILNSSVNNDSKSNNKQNKS